MGWWPWWWWVIAIIIAIITLIFLYHIGDAVWYISKGIANFLDGVTGKLPWPKKDKNKK